MSANIQKGRTLFLGKLFVIGFFLAAQTYWWHLCNPASLEATPAQAVAQLENAPNPMPQPNVALQHASMWGWVAWALLSAMLLWGPQILAGLRGVNRQVEEMIDGDPS